MNITLSADAEVVRRARAVARRQGRSLNHAVREFLQSLASPGGKADAAEELFRLMDEAGANLHGWKWNRDEIYERKVLSGHQHSGLRRGRKRA